MKLVKKRLMDLKSAEYNPRKSLIPSDPEYQKIAASIEEFGYVDPIIINSDDTIIGGHQRRTILLDLGYSEADCILINMDKTREKALNIALNKISGAWDEDALKNLLIDLDRADYDVSLTGFDDQEIEKLFADVCITQEANDDGYDLEAKQEALKEISVSLGDIWQLGRHFLMCGNAVNFSDVEKFMCGKEADLIITDPPYNVDYEEKDKSLEKLLKRNCTRVTNEIKNDRVKSAAFYKFLYQAFCNFSKVAKMGCPIYIFHSEHEGINFRMAMKEAGFYQAQTLIWEKSQFVIGRQDYQWRHEPILYGWKEGAGHYFGGGRGQDTVWIEEEQDYSSMKKTELIAFLERIREQVQKDSTVLFEKKPNRSDLHPTMKPISLLGRFISNSSRKNETVVDFFGGSGTTLIACEQLDRNAYIMELNQEYCKIIIDRWEAYTGQKAEKIRGGGGKT